MDRKENLGERIREFRKSLGLSVEEFVNKTNQRLGEKRYSKEQLYKLETTYAKVSANFMLDVSEAFGVSLDELYKGKKVYTLEELKNHPDHGVRAEEYKHFLTYAKSIVGQEADPSINELLAKLEKSVEDMEKLSSDIVSLRAKLEYATEIINSLAYKIR